MNQILRVLVNRNTPLLSHCGTFLSQNYRRQRGEKKPIPDEQKDDKYFERRRRNNQAAKKSRDARKLREDQVNRYQLRNILFFVF